jgi:3'(2'),5'-bisphosphate nucleotidase
LLLADSLAVGDRCEHSRFPVSSFPFDFAHAGANETAAFLAEAALAAGPAVMEVYGSGGDVGVKADGSPVTAADRRAEAIVCGHLARALHTPPIAAEESIAAGKCPAVGERFLLVDPLDGTREFISRNGEFTINVALIEHGRPIAGAVYAPAIARLWFGGERAFACAAAVASGLPDRSAWRAIHVRPAPPRLVALASRSHADPETEAFLARLPIAERLARGSSLKFCVIAEGSADVYPRFGATMEWDTAAGDAVLRAAGGVVLTSSGAPLAYGKVAEGLCNPAFVAWGDARAPQRARKR